MPILSYILLTHFFGVLTTFSCVWLFSVQIPFGCLLCSTWLFVIFCVLHIVNQLGGSSLKRCWNIFITSLMVTVVPVSIMQFFSVLSYKLDVHYQKTCETKNYQQTKHWTSVTSANCMCTHYISCQLSTNVTIHTYVYEIPSVFFLVNITFIKMVPLYGRTLYNFMMWWRCFYLFLNCF